MRLQYHTAYAISGMISALRATASHPDGYRYADSELHGLPLFDTLIEVGENPFAAPKASLQ